MLRTTKNGILIAVIDLVASNPSIPVRKVDKITSGAVIAINQPKKSFPDIERSHGLSMQDKSIHLNMKSFSAQVRH